MIEFDVEGMTCQHCVRAVTEAIRAVHPGAEVAVDLAAGKVSVPAAAAAEAAALAAAIEDEGYKVKRPA